MDEVDFGDSELFQQLEDSAPPVSRHIRFTEDEGEDEEANELRSRLEECEDTIERLSEENILVCVCSMFAISSPDQKLPICKIYYLFLLRVALFP